MPVVWKGWSLKWFKIWTFRILLPIFFFTFLILYRCIKITYLIHAQNLRIVDNKNDARCYFTSKCKISPRVIYFIEINSSEQAESPDPIFTFIFLIMLFPLSLRSEFHFFLVGHGLSCFPWPKFHFSPLSHGLPCSSMTWISFFSSRSWFSLLLHDLNFIFFF